MQTLTIQKEFQPFKCKFEPFERGWMWIPTTWKRFQSFECKFEQFERDL